MKKLLLFVFIAISVSAIAQNTWTQKTDFGGAARETAVGFSIGNKGYIGTGYDGGVNWFNDFWEYDPITDTWTQKANLGGPPRGGAVGFAIGNKGYIGTGSDSIGDLLNDFWQYDPAINTWIQKSDFPGTPREWASGFSIGSKGYLGIGADWLNTPIDFYEYDPVTDIWTQKADFAGPGRYLAVSFSIGNNGYIGTGTDDNQMCYNDFWEYNPIANIWVQKANFGGMPRQGSIGFSIGSRGYIGLGEDFCGLGGLQGDFWEYIPFLNAWKHRSSPIPEYDLWAWGVGFSIADKGYFGTGDHFVTTPMTKQFYEYIPDTVNSNCAANFSLTADTIPYTWIAMNYAAGVPPLSYWWSWGDGSFSTGATPTHTYSSAGYYNICLAIHDAVGCIDTFCYNSYLNRLSSNSTMITVNVVNSVTGISEQLLNDHSLLISPNPSTGKIQITKSINNVAPIQCEIWNVMGEMVFKTQLQTSNWKLEATLDVSFLKKGIYIIRVLDGVNWEQKKLLLE